jgi:diguanylate cyclase (GGDEF)-like protein
MPARRRVLIIGKGDKPGKEQEYLFEAKGYQIISSPTFKKAMDTIFNDPPDLILVMADMQDKVELEMLQAVKGGIYCAHIPFIIALSREAISTGIEWEQYPVDDFISKPIDYTELFARMSLCFERMQRVFDNNPLTRLPGNTSILKTIQAALDAGEEVAIGYVDIDNFKPYNDRYGFSRGDEVIRMVAMLLTNILRETDTRKVFAGHVGGDDFSFTVPSDRATQVCEKIISSFDALVKNLVDKDDLKRNCFVARDRQGNEQHFPLPSLSIAVVSNNNNLFRHYGEVAEAATQIKKHLKSMEGSNYLIDRRKPPE